MIPKLNQEDISHAETTTTGRDGTIQFKFDADSDDLEPYKVLPAAKTILITFPLKGPGQSKNLTGRYRKVHGGENFWIQLGSTGIFSESDGFIDENSAYDKSNLRAVAEDELRDCVKGCVLNLSGLYGGTREPRNWLTRLAKTKEDVKERGSVQFVHGEDVAKAITAVHHKPTLGKRWIVADLRVYDWWDLILSFSSLVPDDEGVEEREVRLRFGKWVVELMAEEKIRALPRPVEMLPRKLDSRGFWSEMGTWPGHRRLA